MGTRAARTVLLVGLCVAIVSVPAAAQRLPLRNYSSADGLAGDDVTALLVDSRGFLWVGTTTGLSRFDGKEFKTFGRPDGLPHSRVNALLEDRAGTIWVGTAAGAVRIDSDRNVMSPVDLGSESGANVACFDQTRDGRLWVVAGRKLFVAADQSAPFRDVRLPVLDRNGPENPRFSIETLAEGRDGDLWIGTIAGLLRRLKDGRILRIAVRPTGPDDDRIKHVAVDDQGRLWITHWGVAHRPGIHFGVYVFMPHAADQAELDVRTPLHPRAYSVRGSEPGVVAESARGCRVSHRRQSHRRRPRLRRIADRRRRVAHDDQRAAAASRNAGRTLRRAARHRHRHPDGGAGQGAQFVARNSWFGRDPAGPRRIQDLRRICRRSARRDRGHS